MEGAGIRGGGAAGGTGNGRNASTLVSGAGEPEARKRKGQKDREGQRHNPGTRRKLRAKLLCRHSVFRDFICIPPPHPTTLFPPFWSSSVFPLHLSGISLPLSLSITATCPAFRTTPHPYKPLPGALSDPSAPFRLPATSLGLALHLHFTC